MSRLLFVAAVFALVAASSAAEPVPSRERCDVNHDQWVDCRGSVPLFGLGGVHPAPYGHAYCGSQEIPCEWEANTGSASIAFGVAGEYFVRGSMVKGTPCSSTVFGDPSPDRYKACYASTTGGPDASPDYRICAAEGQWCAFTGTRDVAFGSSGSFHLRTGLEGGVPCTAGTFSRITEADPVCHVSVGGNAPRALIGATAHPACGWVDDGDLFHPHTPGPGCALWAGLGHGDFSIPMPNMGP